MKPHIRIMPGTGCWQCVSHVDYGDYHSRWGKTPREAYYNWRNS